MVHTEIVLQSDGGEGLRGGFDLYALFGLDCLMETVAPTATFHDTACLLIDNLHLTVHDDIVVVLHEHGVGLQQLLDGVNALSFQRIILHKGVLLGETLFLAVELLVLQFG